MDSEASSNEAASRARPQWWRRLECAIVLGVLVVLSVLLLPELDGPGSREAARRADCVNNLRQICVGLQNYHDQNKCWPPAYLTDEDGKPIHSWRALILPYLEDEQLSKLAKEYRFDEPWNGPNNRKLADKMPELFRCPSHEAKDNNTGYVAIVGAPTAWPGDEGVSIKDVHDGTSRTIQIVEIADSGINWLEPRDLSFDEALQGINPPDTKLSISSAHPGGSNFLFCDGSVHFLPDDVPLETLRGLLTRDGGEDVELPE